MEFNPNPSIAVIGLGYVGLPLAVAMAQHFSVTGFDINETRIQELKRGIDKTREITEESLQKTSLKFTMDSSLLLAHDIYIVTVPTPITEDNLPDLTPLQKASETLAKVIAKNAIVVYESTVYPGVTEDFCGPIIEKISSLKAGVDFYLGYSPERINPGDKEHTIERITKIVSGQTPQVAEILRRIYGAVNQNNIYVAKNIKTAEAAKVIENAQRDINIAFVNEVAMIVGKLGLSAYDVLHAAGTKWNFLKFQPGLVGGHCIGVDPYYLAHCAEKVMHTPEVILAGRRINESMGFYMANCIHQRLQAIHQNPNIKTRILILGLTFKANISDLRNSKVVNLIDHLRTFGHSIEITDPFADPIEAETHLNLKIETELGLNNVYDCVVGAVAHTPYAMLPLESLQALLKPNGLVADLKNMWATYSFTKEFYYWTL
jgi:UDP-N-acetyl-D-galactosamine dehydrogenase